MKTNIVLAIGILLVGSILFTIFVSNSNAASASETSYSSNAVDPSMQDQVLNENAASDAKIKNKVINKKLLNTERKAAAGRYKKSGASVTAGIAALPAGMDPGGLPHYYGPYPNYANSPMPVSGATITISAPTAGTTATASATVVNGVVTGLALINGGSGYTSVPTVSITGGGGTGAIATATVAGSVTGITLNTGGNGYTSAPVVNFTGGGGTGAAATANVTGFVSSLTLDTSGARYIAPVVTISGGGATTNATATVTGPVDALTLNTQGAGYTAPNITFSGIGGAIATATGSVDNITVTATGSGYTIAPNVTITPVAGDTTGSGATASATIDPTTGQVINISILNPGTNYTSAPIVTITNATGDTTGSGATASATISVTGITLTSGGAGYTSAPAVTITDSGTGSGATASATISVTGITLTSRGAGYTSAPAVTITDSGTGSGATATAAVTMDTVSSIIITSGGTGYTSAPAVSLSGGGTGAAATATITTDVVSALTLVSGGSGYVGGGIRKFVDSLPGLNAEGANNLGQYMPVAIPDKTTYPGSDYYEIELGEYTEKMHSDLPSTTLRGYRQTNTVDPNVSKFHYLGPLIIATRDTPVRIKFTNKLPTGAGGDLFLPVDTTIMGAGPFMINDPLGGTISGNFTQNRATLHLHGGFVPWISDGTPHQWITPAGENTSYPKGVSVKNVPDMADPGNGSMTFYYNNQQSARLQFYHDHAFGITRLNVYAGEAAGYLLTDKAEQDMISGTNNSGVNPGNVTVLPGVGIPLIIQDKTFVDNTTIAQQDPTWNWGTGPRDPITGKITGVNTGDLWLPHVFMPNQNPADPSGMNAFGRWFYSPWFFPAPTDIIKGPIPNPYCLPTPGVDCSGSVWPLENTLIPDVPNPSYAMEAFMDTPIVNGAAYPNITVEPKAYRFRILNAGNDRFLNLQLYQATNIVNSITLTNGGSGYTSDPVLTITPNTGDTTGHGATATATVDLTPGSITYGQVTAINLMTVGSGYTSAPIVTIAPPTTGTQATATATIYTSLTEVGMVPAVPTSGFPAGWPTDGRDGGVPDPATAGPSFIQIGTEGGFLPAPVVLPNQPVDWNMDQTNFDFGVVNKGTLILGTAERADVIVDFTNFSGKTIILYNDAPAPFPAIDPRYNYYTGNPDLRDIGGAPSTFAGYGPNTRTIMQIRVNNTAPAAPPYDLAALQAVFAQTAGKRGVFESSQDEIIVQQKAYETAYNKTYPADRFVGINDLSKTFQTALGTNMTIQFQAKAIHDEPSGVYNVEDGRMSAMLGVTVLGRPMTFIPIPYAAPPVEIIKDSVYGTPLGSLGDGTQIWKITHNGVDTHTVHFHLFNVQLINRVAWDNAIRKPDLNEVGWKETVRVNPLQDTIVALRPTTPTQPFEVPNSIRPIDVTMPVGSPLKPPPFGWQDVNGNPVTVLNKMVNFGWEYVYHCHLLGHEEMDMMHEVSLAVAPVAPSNLSATGLSGPLRVALTWTDNSVSETNFTIQRATDANFTIGLTNFTVAGSVPNNATGGTIGFTDTAVAASTTYYYRVIATNKVGDTTVYPAPAVGFPAMSVNSAPSNAVTAGPPADPPSNLNASQPDPANSAPVVLNWTDNSPNVPNPPNFNAETSFTVQRSTNGGGTWITRATLPANTVTYTDPTSGKNGVKRGTTYMYRILANNIFGSSTSNTATITTR